MWPLSKKPNNNDILEEIAMALAQSLLPLVRQHTEGFAKIADVWKNSFNKTADDFSLGELFIEIVSVYLVFINRVVATVISKKDKTLFIVTFQEQFVGLALKENYGVNSDLIKDAFISDLNKHLDIYGPIPFSHEENKGKVGTLVWEFAENVAKLLGQENNTFLIEQVKFATLKDFASLQEIIPEAISKN